MRRLVGGLVIMLVSLGWGRFSFGQEVPSPRAELRIGDKSPVNWISMTFGYVASGREPLCQSGEGSGQWAERVRVVQCASSRRPVARCAAAPGRESGH